MRGMVVKALHNFHAVAVENPIWPGTPDVNYSLGWIELKELKGWPEQEDTPVLIDHFTQEQRLFSKMRGRAGGSSILILKVGNEWLFFNGEPVWESVGKVCKADLFLYAQKYFAKNPSLDELRDAVLTVS